MFHPPATPVVNKSHNNLVFYVKQMFHDSFFALAWRAGGETLKYIKNLKIHEVLFYLFLVTLPLQTRILYKPDSAYISWYFNYHLAFFVYLTDIILISCFTAWLIFDRPSEKLFVTRLFWLTLAFFCLILVTLFHPPATPITEALNLAWRAGVKRLDLGWYQTFKWVELFILMFYVRETFKTKTQYLWAFSIIFICSTAEAVIALIQFHVQHSLNLGFLGEYIAPLGTSGLATIETATGKIIRAYGTFPHPNVLGAFLLLGLICGLYLLSCETLKRPHPRESGDPLQLLIPNGFNRRSGSQIKSGMVMLGIILLILGIYITFSRLAWFGAILSIIAFLLFHVKHKQWTKTIIILILLIVSYATIFGLFHETLRARVIDTNSTSVNDRYFFNALGLDLTARYPLLGVGVGNYMEALKDLYQLQPWQNQPSHNIFIFLSAELGILGLILFIMILFEIFSNFKIVSWDSLTFTLACVGIIFLLMSQFDHYFVTIQQGRLMLFTVLGLISALPNLQHEIPNDKLQIPNKHQ